MALVQNVDARIAEVAETGADLKAEGADAPEKKNTKKKHQVVAEEVQDWYVEWFAAKQQLGWTHHQAYEAAAELAPSLFASIHRDTPWQWKHSSELKGKKDKKGPPFKLTAGESSIVQETIQNACSRLPLFPVCSRRLCESGSLKARCGQEGGTNLPLRLSHSIAVEMAKAFGEGITPYWRRGCCGCAAESS